MIYAPQIIKNQAGDVESIVGNLSNILDERPAVFGSISVSSIGQALNPQVVGAVLPGGKPATSSLGEEDLLGTDLHGQQVTNKILVSFSNLFLIQRDQALVGGDLDKNDTVNAFKALSEEASGWLENVFLALTDRDKVNTIFTNIEQGGSTASKINSEFPNVVYPENPFNVPLRVLTESQVPQKYLSVLKGIFSPPPPSAASGTAGLPKDGVVLQTLGDVEKALKKKRNVAKFVAASALGTVSFKDGGSITNVSFQAPNKCFTDAINISSESARSEEIKQMYDGLVNPDGEGLSTKNEGIFASSKFKSHHTLIYLPAQVAKHFGNFNFEDQPLAKLDPRDVKNNSRVHALHFSPTSSSSSSLRVEKEKQDDKMDQTAAKTDQPDQYKRKAREAIAVLGDVTSTNDAMSLGVNFHSLLLLSVPEIVEGVTAVNSAIIFQILNELHDLFSHPKIKSWEDKNKPSGLMPHFPFFVLKQFETAVLAYVKTGIHLQSKRAVEGNDPSIFPLSIYLSVVKNIAKLRQSLEEHIANDTPLDKVGSYVPESYHPALIEKKAMRIAAEQSATAAVNSRNHQQANHHQRNQQQQPTGATDQSSSNGERGGAGRGYLGQGNEGRGYGGRGPTSSGRGSGGQSNGGRGNPGRGRAIGGRGGRGSGNARVSGINLGSLFRNPTVSDNNLLPQGLSREYCSDWMYIGSECTKGYGQCSWHTNIDDMRNEDDKKLICDHVTNTQGLWFNKSRVRSLTDPRHKAMLGGGGGPGTD